MKMLVICTDEAMLDGFKFGYAEADPDSEFTQSVDERGYWLLIENDVDADDKTYRLDEFGGGLKHIATGIEV